MIDEHISVHDAFHLEIRQRLPFSPDGSSSAYTSETFLFVPQSLNINRDTFPKAHFYRSLKNYIRLQVPTVLLAQLMGKRSLLADLDKDFRHLPDSYNGIPLSSKQEAAIRRHEDKTKIFCLTLQQAVREAAADVTDGPVRAEAGERCVALVHTARALLNQVGRLGAEAAGEVPMHIKACQEFCSGVISYYALSLLRFFKQCADLPGNEQARAALLDLIREGAARCETFSPDSTPRPDGDSAAFVFRWSTLKKYISTPLFLDIRRKREGAFIQHIAYSIAAALAMIFATAIAFIWQIEYGAVSLPLFVALVVSYIFKDRLKDILRDYMTAVFSRYVFDRRLSIYRNTTSLGSCRELFDFLEPKHLPSDVRAVRELTADELPFALRREEIMYYRKNILVRAGDRAGFDSKGLLDITRLNLRGISRNMEGDTEELLFLDGAVPKQTTGIKTYSFYVVRRHSHGGVRICTAFRVLMDHAGARAIQRLYPVSGRAEDEGCFPAIC